MHSVQTQNTVLGIYIPRFEEERRRGRSGPGAACACLPIKILTLLGWCNRAYVNSLLFERHYYTSGGFDTIQTRFILSS